MQTNACILQSECAEVVQEGRTPEVIQAVLPKRGQWIRDVCLLRKVIKDQPPAHLNVLLSLILSADVLFSIHVSLPSQLFE